MQFRIISFLLIPFINIKDVKTNTSFLGYFFLTKCILKYNNFFDLSFSK